jgi:hypothetical protein
MKEHLLQFFSTVFIIGLSWHVSMNYNIVVFAPLFILLIFFMKNPFPINMKHFYIVLAFILVFVFWSLLNITIYDKVNLAVTDKFLRKAIFGVVIMSFIFLFYEKRLELLKRSIDYALGTIFLLWLMQLVVFYSTGEYIDLLQPFAGAERAQRYQAYFIQAVLPIDFIRPTSIYIEPGTYAVNTFPLMVLSYLNHNKITRLHKALLFSYFLSLSLFAIIIATLFIFTVEFSKFKFKLNKKNMLLIFMIILIISGIMFYIQYRFIDQGGTEQLGYRELIINYWLSLDSYDTLFGLGNGQVVFDGSTPALIEDVSFLFKLTFEFGIFALPYLAILIYISRGLPVIFLFIILLSKIHYQIYIMWFYPAALFMIWHTERRNKI